MLARTSHLFVKRTNFSSNKIIKRNYVGGVMGDAMYGAVMFKFLAPFVGLLLYPIFKLIDREDKSYSHQKSNLRDDSIQDEAKRILNQPIRNLTFEESMRDAKNDKTYDDWFYKRT